MPFRFFILHSIYGKLTVQFQGKISFVHIVPIVINPLHNGYPHLSRHGRHPTEGSDEAELDEEPHGLEYSIM